MALMAIALDNATMEFNLQMSWMARLKMVFFVLIGRRFCITQLKVNLMDTDVEIYESRRRSR